MRAAALSLALLTASAAAEPPDAPRMERVAGGYLLNEAGYRRLEAETTRLQLAERSLKGRVAELEASQGVPLEAVGLLVGLAGAAGLVAGVLLLGSVTR